MIYRTIATRGPAHLVGALRLVVLPVGQPHGQELVENVEQQDSNQVQQRGRHRRHQRCILILELELICEETMIIITSTTK